MSQGIKDRVTNEYDFFGPECYQGIFHGEKVCMGPTVLFEQVGPTFLVDVNGNKLALQSKSTIFPELLNIGFSKFYPQLIGPFDTYVHGLESGGILRFWELKRIGFAEKKGQKYARNHFKVLKIYAGEREEGNENRQVVHLSLWLLGDGLLFAFICFIFEVSPLHVWLRYYMPQLFYFRVLLLLEKFSVRLKSAGVTFAT
ncbi:unnamed protein product [Allacma fusca]|uniref:Uncharacterized protein n=1 Tax=Allacma fusca TaxID=39272 RepID=A0A8J2KER0_9HEXA|nr:unnamed protein product [Allacma fusca]